MFRSILVPLDGSRFAEAALATAIRFARSARADLHVALAHQPSAALVGMGEFALPTPGFDEEQRLRERAYLVETVAGIGQVGKGPVDFHELEGSAGPAICEEVTRLGIDLVVMATHGRGALGRLWLGSVADYVIRHLSVPVLLVHPDRTGEPRPTTHIHGILVALDLSPQAEAVLEPVTAIAQLTQAHVTLLHVVEPFYAMPEPAVPYPIPQEPAITELRRTEAQRQLDRVADRLRDRGLSVSTRVVIGFSAAGELLNALEGPGLDLVGLTTHGTGGMKRLLLGSVADKVVRGAAKPVLVLHPPPVA
jgi:nucleotide-binding universal stress UspA family protein